MGDIHSIAEAAATPSLACSMTDQSSLLSDRSVPDMIGALARSWLEHGDSAHMMLSEQLAILWANAAALSALAEGRDVENRCGILSTINGALQPLLHAFVVNSSPSITSWSIPRIDGDGRLIFRAQRIPGGERVYGVTFFGSGSEFQLRFLELEQVFHLTRSEHRVLMELANGHEAEPIARMLNVSVETTRSHIRSIYRKLNVRSREALFYRMQPYRF